MLNLFRRKLSNSRKIVDPSLRHRDHTRLAAIAAQAQAEADRHAYWLSEYERVNYYGDYDYKRYLDAGSPPVVGTARQAEFITPPPTPEQWAKLTPEQKAVPGSVPPENL